MKMQTDTTNVELIVKYLAGECTPDEAMALHDWMAIPENKRQFEELKRLWELIPPHQAFETRDSKVGWQELQQSLSAAKKGKIVKMKWLAIAATFAGLIITISIFLFQNNSTPFPSLSKSSADSIMQYTLPDGSAAVLNKKSTLVHTENFSQIDRAIELRGEAFFDVVPDKKKPFIISIDDLKIQVVGTSFNVKEIDTTSIEVSVQSGIVKMYTKKNTLLIKKGQTGIYYKEGGELRLLDTLDVNSLSYATKTFTFNDVSLNIVCRNLEKAFGTTIVEDKMKLSDCRLTANFEKKSLEYILEVICATLGTNYRKEQNIIYLTGNGCQ